MYVITETGFKTSFQMEAYSNTLLGVFKSSQSAENQDLRPSFFNVK